MARSRERRMNRVPFSSAAGRCQLYHARTRPHRDPDRLDSAHGDGGGLLGPCPFPVEHRSGIRAHASSVAITTSSNLLGFLLGQAVAGPLSDFIGRWRVFRIGVAGFAISSGACAKAALLDTLILFRTIQGFASLCGGVVLPAFVNDLFDYTKRVWAHEPLRNCRKSGTDRRSQRWRPVRALPVLVLRLCHALGLLRRPLGQRDVRQRIQFDPA